MLQGDCACRPVLLLGALRQERAGGSLAVMALVEAAAAVICPPGVQTTDPIILSAMLQVSHWSTIALIAPFVDCGYSTYLSCKHRMASGFVTLQSMIVDAQLVRLAC